MDRKESKMSLVANKQYTCVAKTLSIRPKLSCPEILSMITQMPLPSLCSMHAYSCHESHAADGAVLDRRAVAAPRQTVAAAIRTPAFSTAAAAAPTSIAR